MRSSFIFQTVLIMTSSVSRGVCTFQPFVSSKHFQLLLSAEWEQHISDVNHKMDVVLHGWVSTPRYTRSYQRYTVHERALYFKSTFSWVTMHVRLKTHLTKFSLFFPYNCIRQPISGRL